MSSNSVSGRVKRAAERAAQKDSNEEQYNGSKRRKREKRQYRRSTTPVQDHSPTVDEVPEALPANAPVVNLLDLESDDELDDSQKGLKEEGQGNKVTRDPDDIVDPRHPDWVPFPQRPAEVVFSTTTIVVDQVEDEADEFAWIPRRRRITCHEFAHQGEPDRLTELLSHAHRSELNSIVYNAHYDVSSTITSFATADSLPVRTKGLTFLPTKRDQEKVLGIVVTLSGTADPLLMAVTHLCMAFAHETLRAFEIVSLREMYSAQLDRTNVMSGKPLPQPRADGQIRQYLAFDHIKQQELDDIEEPAPAFSQENVVHTYPDHGIHAATTISSAKRAPSTLSAS